MTKRVRIFRFPQNVKKKKFNKKKAEFVGVTESDCQPASHSVRAVCAGRQKAVRQHCVAELVMGALKLVLVVGGSGSLSSCSVMRNIATNNASVTV